MKWDLISDTSRSGRNTSVILLLSTRQPKSFSFSQSFFLNCYFKTLKTLNLKGNPMQFQKCTFQCFKVF